MTSLLTLIVGGVIVLALHAPYVRSYASDLGGTWKGGDGAISLELDVAQRADSVSGTAWLQWPPDQHDEVTQDELTLSGSGDEIGRVLDILHAEREVPSYTFVGRVVRRGVIRGHFIGDANDLPPFTLLRATRSIGNRLP